MVTNDKGIIGFKHKIMEEVCRLAWEDKLDEQHKEQLCYKIIPGPKPEYRCCVYKEREIVRQRIRLACGMSTSYNEDSHNVVQVIDPACDECPIASFSVTDNCRFCIGKACLNSCKFEAIHPGDVKMHIKTYI